MKLPRLQFLITVLALSSFLGCSSEPPKPAGPDWIHQPTRTVDGGYIVYIESDSGPNEDKAKMKAEGLALSDLANECSFIPKGARIEDRWVEKSNTGATAWVKLGLEFQECTEAQKATEPDAIRRVASESFMQTLKSYQDYEETGDSSPSREYLNEEAIADLPPPPPQQGSPDGVHFYVLRQYVAYQKEVVILSPPYTFKPNSPEYQTYASNVTPAVQRIGVIQETQPNLGKQPTAWSKVPDRPKFARPSGLVRRQSAFKPLNIPTRPQPMARQNNRSNGRKGNFGKGGRGYKGPNEREKEKENRE